MENSWKRYYRKNIGNYLLIIGLVVILILNFNEYSLYQRITTVNFYLISAILTVVFLCYFDFNEAKKNVKLYLGAGTCILTAAFLLVSKSYFITFFVVYSIALMLYLADKVQLTRIQIITTSAIVAAFFIYWTVDIKGYFKGYTTNFGGLVLLSGFVFLIMLMEYVKYSVINCKKENVVVFFFKKYPYYITFLECLLFVWAYYIMSYYQSRTAVVSIVVFGILLMIPKKVISNKCVADVLFIVSVLFSIVFPFLYIRSASFGSINELQIFYKPVFSNRVENYSFLVTLLKQHLMLGNGSIYVSEGMTFRPGLLDTCNGFMQVAVPNGIIVAVLVMILILHTGIKLASKLRNNLMSTSAFAGCITFIIASASESFAVIAPFSLIFAMMLFVVNSECELEKDDVTDVCDIYRKLWTEEYRNKFIPVALVTMMLLFMYLILGPLEIFYANNRAVEFEFNSWDFIWAFVAYTIIITVVVSLTMASMPKAVGNAYCTLVFGFSIVSYVQYMFINGRLRNKGGDFSLDSSNIGPRYAISVISFVVIMIIVIVGARLIDERRRNQIFCIGAGCLTLVMAVAVVSIGMGLLRVDNIPRYKYILDASKEFELGSEDNTVIIIVDTWGRELFREQENLHPEDLNFLHDFTLYEKADSVYAPTFPSLIHMLTGNYYDENLSDGEWEIASWETEKAHNFYDELHDKGYYVGIYTTDMYKGDYNKYAIDNLQKGKSVVNRKNVQKNMLTLSVYRYVPYNMKRPFQITNVKDGTVSEEFITPTDNNASFYNRMNDFGIKLSTEHEKVFSVHHIYGMHPYIYNDENLNPVDIDSVSEEQRYKGVLKLLGEFFDDMKALGVYNNANIIIMGDHGANLNTDAVFFMKKAGDSHEEYEISDDKITFHEFHDIIRNCN